MAFGAASAVERGVAETGPVGLLLRLLLFAPRVVGLLAGIGLAVGRGGIGETLFYRGLIDGVDLVSDVPGIGTGIQFGAERIGLREIAVGADESFMVVAETGDLLVGDGRGGGYACFGSGRGGMFFAAIFDGDNVGGDLEVVDGGACADGVELVGEQAVGDLGEHEGDGGIVLKERDGDVFGVGEGGIAVVIVLEAEVDAVDGVVFAAMAADGESAAAGFGLGWDRERRELDGRFVCHEGPFEFRSTTEDTESTER